MYRLIFLLILLLCMPAYADTTIYGSSTVGFSINLSNRVLITFIFDDGMDTDYSLMLPLFQAQGEVACSAISTAHIDAADPGYMTWAQIVALQTAGWEILSHSVTHPDLTTLNDTDLTTEIYNSKTTLESHGLIINSFVYPGGSYNATVQAKTALYYRSGRSTAVRDYTNARPLSLYALSAYPADDPALLSIFESFVDSAKSLRRWVIFFIHGTDAADVTAIGTLIDYIQAAGVPIVTVNEALNLLGTGGE